VKKYINFLLHAHLPFVRETEKEAPLEERWLFEAISETYLPLMRVFRKLDADGVPFKINVSVSPTLGTMLQDELIQERYIAHVNKMLELSEREMIRTTVNPQMNDLVKMYQQLYQKNLDDFVHRYHKNILKGLDYFYKKGKIGVIACPATHPYLPLMEEYPDAVNAQVRMAMQYHYETFGKTSRGFWLPECGYYPGIEKILKENGVRYTFAEAHSLLFAEPRPRYGTYAPVALKNGLSVFGRDLVSANAVWSSEEGYPGDFSYREFYRDIGFDLPLDYIGPYVHEGGHRSFTGFKYYAVTGSTDQKRIYQPSEAARKIEEHAENFIYNQRKRLEKVSALMDIPPVISCYYDAELFGHWWFEGPAWIEAVVRKIAETEELEMVLAGEYCKSAENLQITDPVFGSWGNKGYSEVWLDGRNDWVYRHTHKAVERMLELIRRFPNETGLKERALNQAAREVLLSQASDWPFIMRAGTTVPYAVRRVKEHIYNFTTIYDALFRGTVSPEWLTRLERKNNIFPNIDYRIFNASS
jgi:1,4-alpha-glucan branching enzyme